MGLSATTTKKTPGHEKEGGGGKDQLLPKCENYEIL